MVNYSVVGYRYEEEDNVRGEILLLVGRDKKLYEEVGKKDNAYPKLDLHKLRHLIESLVMKRVDRYDYHKKDGKEQYYDMQYCIDSPFLEYIVGFLL